METPFATLPFLTKLTGFREPEMHRYDVCLYRYDHKACEQEGQGNCDTAAGVYYGCSDAFGAKLCPRHFYESHFGPNAYGRLVDLPEAAA